MRAAAQEPLKNAGASAEGASCGLFAPLRTPQRVRDRAGLASPGKVKQRAEPPERGRVKCQHSGKVLTRRHIPSGPDAAGARCTTPQKFPPQKTKRPQRRGRFFFAVTELRHRRPEASVGWIAWRKRPFSLRAPSAATRPGAGSGSARAATRSGPSSKRSSARSLPARRRRSRSCASSTSRSRRRSGSRPASPSSTACSAAASCRPRSCSSAASRAWASRRSSSPRSS